MVSNALEQLRPALWRRLGAFRVALCVPWRSSLAGSSHVGRFVESQVAFLLACRYRDGRHVDAGVPDAKVSDDHICWVHKIDGQICKSDPLDPSSLVKRISCNHFFPHYLFSHNLGFSIHSYSQTQRSHSSYSFDFVGAKDSEPDHGQRNADGLGPPEASLPKLGPLGRGPPGSWYNVENCIDGSDDLENHGLSQLALVRHNCISVDTTTGSTWTCDVCDLKDLFQSQVGLVRTALRAFQCQGRLSCRT